MGKSGEPFEASILENWYLVWPINRVLAKPLAKVLAVAM